MCLKRIPTGDSDMSIGTVFQNNRMWAVRLSVDLRFEDNVKKVLVHAQSKERILRSINHGWDSGFHAQERRG